VLLLLDAQLTYEKAIFQRHRRVLPGIETGAW